MPYSAVTDLMTGDIPLPSRFGNGQKFVELAADEIDGQLGHLYVTPISFDESTTEKAQRARPAKLLLKKINNLLASGRIILDMAAGGEDDSLHSYGRSMWNEAIGLLRDLASGKVEFPALRIEATDLPDDTGPMIRNEDETSLVEGYYGTFGSFLTVPVLTREPPLRPYMGN